jgi:glycosyltransferase involved in cell wall biosynthesis
VKQIDLIIPLFNESQTVESLVRRLEKVFGCALGGYAFYVIFVNDGSRDDTLQKLRHLCQTFSLSSRIISLSRNFGHQPAVVAGLEASVGDAAVVLDGDLQDPPEVVFEMVRKWEAGFRVVYARRASRRGESAFKLATASLFYRFIRAASNVDIPRDTGDFRLIDRVVVQSLNALPEHNRFIRGLVPWLGYRHAFVDFERQERVGGETKYTMAKMAKLAIDGISSFSTLPIRMCTYLGIIVITLSMLAALKVAFDKIFTPQYVITGWASVIIAILFFGGIQLLFLGIIGEYIARIFDEVKGRPNYIVDESFNFPRVIDQSRFDFQKES